MINVVYCGQFRDFTGYGVAARGYLKSFEEYEKISQKDRERDNFGNQKVNLKIYSIVGADGSKKISDEEMSLIEKYEFKNDEEIQEFIKEDYICVWHMPSALSMFCDDRFSCTPGCSKSFKKLMNCSSENVHFLVWETDEIPQEWKTAINYWNPSKILTACEWNRKSFEKVRETEVVPHLIEESYAGTNKILESFGLEDKFVVLSISQWSERKGFDFLLKAFISELGDKKDAVLLIKTYENYDVNSQLIQQEIRHYKDIIRVDNKQNNIMLLMEFLDEKSKNYLYEVSDVFALLSRGEGFSLPMAESIMFKTPVMAPVGGGHIDYLDPSHSFLVDGMWDTCISHRLPYDIDGKWFVPNVSSARDQLNKAYQLWKEDPANLKLIGQKAFDHIKQSGYDRYSIGRKFAQSLESKPNNRSKLKTRIKDLKKLMAQTDDINKKLSILKDSFKGERCYILSCGPSINDINNDKFREMIKDELVFSVKQVIELFENETDFHFFNCANLPIPKEKYLLQNYQYKQDLISVASSNYPLGSRWSQNQKNDLFFKIPIRTEIDNEFICLTKQFEKYTMSNTPERPCGPGIMYETVIFMAEHLGVKEIIVAGWDLSMEDKMTEKKYEHFYDSSSKMAIKGDVLPWEVKATCEASKDLYLWLKEKDIELKLLSDQSSLWQGIPRIKIGDIS